VTGAGLGAGPRPPRLVATDLDGTLVRSDGSIGGRTVEVVERLEQAGAAFVMVTGRPPRWMSVVADEIGHHGLAVCANGAILYDLRTEQVVRAHLLEAAQAVAVVEALRAATCPASPSPSRRDRWGASLVPSPASTSTCRGGTTARWLSRTSR